MHAHRRSATRRPQTPDSSPALRTVSRRHWRVGIFTTSTSCNLITATSGKAFVGDWIGPFQPGHLVLCGPRLPHNWISMDMPDCGVAERDLVIQFERGPIAHAAEVMPELAEVMALLERARHGVEFFGLGERAAQHFHAVKAARGIQRLAAFCAYIGDLARCTDFACCLPCACRAKTTTTPAPTRSTRWSTASRATWRSRCLRRTSPPNSA